jgi:hypothetical protein
MVIIYSLIYNKQFKSEINYFEELKLKSKISNDKFRKTHHLY